MTPWTRLARRPGASTRRSSKETPSWRAPRPRRTSRAASAGCGRSWPRLRRRRRRPDEHRALKATERVTLGRTTLSVTRLGLGAAPLAGLFEEVPEDRALAVGARAWGGGIRFYDVAPLYGHGRGE